MCDGISPSVFYKPGTPKRRITLKQVTIDTFVPKEFKSIWGPSTTWKIFSRQIEAVNFAKDHGGGLMSFAFQRLDGTRGFLAADPVVFWWHDCRKEPSNRRTFEIIVENEPCKLYLDLEFDRSCNPDHDGVRMTNTLIEIFCAILKREFGLECDRSSVLDLDSTTETKFSRHLIFHLENTCFRNNYHVGSFVKKVCHEIRGRQMSGDSLCGHSVETLNELFVKYKKSNVNLFVDEGVYTKNRHFRLFQSTKWKKNAPLVVSNENVFKVQPKTSKKVSVDEYLFLDSLVTYVSDCRENILEMADATCVSYAGRKESGKSSLSSKPIQSDMFVGSSPIPAVDKFIQDKVYPGHVRRWAYFVENGTLDYDIIGNRYCNNIGRAHKSNNVKYVVDLKKGVFYQKCYDSDCAGYRSPEVPIPTEVLFLLDNEDIEFAEVSQLSDKDLTEVWESINALTKEESLKESSSSSNSTTNENKNFPEFGLSDLDLLATMDVN